jgi:hypothetical protein
VWGQVGTRLEEWCSLRVHRSLMALVLVFLFNVLPLTVLSAGVLSLLPAGAPAGRLAAASHVAPTATPLPEPTPTPDRWREWGRGMATWYAGPSDWMRNGERFDLAGLTCAVDVSDWEALEGKELRIRRQDGSDEGFIVRVTDTGYLKRAGRFVLDPASGQPVRSASPDEGQFIIVDLPRDTHQRFFQGATTPVIVEVRDEVAGPVASD